MAERMLRRPLYFAGAMVAAGDAAAMVAGVANPTRRVIEAGLITIGLAPGIATPSSFFLMLVPAAGGDRKPYIFADCAINAEPSARELADIAIASAESAQGLLGASRAWRCCRSRPMAAPATRASTRCARRWRSCEGCGPISPSTASCRATPRSRRAVAAKKVQGASAVAGRANVLIFPDLDSGNIAYKLVQHLGGATAIGPFLQGFAKPISRPVARGERRRYRRHRGGSAGALPALRPIDSDGDIEPPADNSGS